MKLIGITGPAGSGKTEIARITVQDHRFVTYNFADPLKRGLEAMFGFTREMWGSREWKEKEFAWLPGASPRKLAQTIGTEWGREIIHPDLWVILAQRWLAEVEDINARWAERFGGRGQVGGVVIADLRFENEAAWIRSAGGEVWHVQRPTKDVVRPHKSEAGVAFTTSDVLVNNTGDLEFLRRHVRALLTAFTPVQPAMRLAPELRST